MDTVELNEAFAAQVIPIMDECDIPLEKMNPHGGAIALGHPFGMTGARIMTTLLNGLETDDKTIGLETMCVAGGQGEAMIVERLGLALAGLHRLAHEARDQLGQRAGLVLGREGAGVVDPLEPGDGAEVARELLAVLGLEEAVLARPGDQRRPAELAQAVGAPRSCSACRARGRPS